MKSLKTPYVLDGSSLLHNLPWHRGVSGMFLQSNDSDTLDKLRYKRFYTKVALSTATVKLESLPPTFYVAVIAVVVWLLIKYISYGKFLAIYMCK